MKVLMVEPVPLCCGDRKWSEILAGGSGRRYSGGLSV